MKSKLIRLGVTVLIVIGGLFLCGMLYELFDRFINGFFVEWFENYYVRQEWREIDSSGAGYYYRTIRWNKLKELLFEALIILVVLWVLSVRVVSILYATWRERKVLHITGQMIGDYMHHDREVGEVFPPDYAEVSVQLAEIKSGIQRQEQLLREESNRKNDLITYLAHDLKTPLTSVV